MPIIRSNHWLQNVLAQWPNIPVYVYDTRLNKSVSFDVALRTVKADLPEQPPALIIYPLVDPNDPKSRIIKP